MPVRNDASSRRVTVGARRSAALCSRKTHSIGKTNDDAQPWSHRLFQQLWRLWEWEVTALTRSHTHTHTVSTDYISCISFYLWSQYRRYMNSFILRQLIPSLTMSKFNFTFRYESFRPQIVSTSEYRMTMKFSKKFSIRLQTTHRKNGRLRRAV